MFALNKVIIMKATIVAVMAFASLQCKAQETPAVVTSSFSKNFPGVTVKEWDKEDNEYEANFTKDGKKMSASFTADGKLQETETDIKVTELPSSVTKYITANYNGATIKEAALIEKDGSKMYEAEVKGKDLLFNVDGKFLKEEED